MVLRGQAEVRDRTEFKVALIRVPGPYKDWYRQPALGPAYLSAYLKADGISCKVFDGRYHAWSTYDLIKRVTAYKPHLIGFTVMTHEVKDAARLAQRLKAGLSAPVVVGGPHATALPGRTLREFPVFDFGVNGEGEKPLLGLASRLRDGYSNLKYIEGITHWDREEVTINARPPALTSRELDTLPFPDFQDYYADDPGALKGSDGCCVIAASRGASNGTLLSLPVVGREIRWRAPDSVLSEMERAVFRWGAHTFEFCDQSIVTEADEPRSILSALAASDLSSRIRWSGYARLGGISRDVLQLARKSGCYLLRLDAGSGDEDILASTGRGFSTETVEADARMIRAEGMELELHFNMGYPGETEESAAKTAHLIAGLNPGSAVINLVVPYPGTGVYEMALRGAGGCRLVSDDWSRYAWYGGETMEVRGLSHGKIAAWRNRALAMLYLRNRRLFDLARYLWLRRSACGFLLLGKLGIRMVARERFTG